MTLIEAFRSRDVVVHTLGDAYPVAVSSSLISSGWQGGQGVSWTLGGTKDTFEVEASTGRYGGFLLWGSDEVPDQYTSITRYQLAYGYAIFCTGNWVAWFSLYEKYTYASRLGGPLVPLTYSPMDRLYFSLRGYFTKEDELTLSGDPRAPASACGFVMIPPASFGDPMLLETSL